MASWLLLAWVVGGGSAGNAREGPPPGTDRIEIQLGLDAYAATMWRAEDQPPAPSNPRDVHLEIAARREAARTYPSGRHLLRW